MVPRAPDPGPSPGQGWKLATTGLLAGFGGGLASLGGGTLIIPLLTEWIGLDRHRARGTAMAVAGFTAIGGALVYGSHGHVQWNTLLWTGIPAALVAPWAARLSIDWPDLVLRRLLGSIMLAGSIALFLHPGPGNGFATQWPWLWLLATGVIAGALAGIVGISGGPVLAPLFVLELGMPQQLAQGSSLNARLPAVIAGVVEDQREGFVMWRMLPLLAAGDLAGIWGGAHLALMLPEPQMRQLFALLLLLLGLHELSGRAARIHRTHR